MEITYSLPFVSDGRAEDETASSELQLEITRMLRDTNVDNECVGWYQSVYYGTTSTPAIVGNQFGYQAGEELSDNSVVLLYDPFRSKKGALVIKAFRLSDEYIEQRRNKSNSFIKPKSIMQELPVKITNSGHSSAFIRCLVDSHASELNNEFDVLSMSSTEDSLVKHFELMNSCLDDLAGEQLRFQQYSRSIAKIRAEHVKALNKRLQENAERAENGEAPLRTTVEACGQKPLPEAPPRLEPLLLLNQANRYSSQINELCEIDAQKLFAVTQSQSR
jgi:translation initiation factor 3 subunit H